MPEPLVDFVEAAYDVDAPLDDWLRRLGHGVRSLVPGGLGVIGYLYDASDASHVRLSSMVMLEPNRAVEAAMAGAHAIGPAWGAKRLYWGGVRVATNSETLGRLWTTFPIFRRFVAPFGGVQDFFALRASDPGQSGVILGTALPECRRVSPADAEMWERLGAHVASGARLRNQHRARDPSGADAVLSPTGEVEHAEGEAKDGPARETLASAARRIDRARGKLRREDPAEAVAIWSALVDGRWSLVDWIDHDGRRYLLARENPPPAAAAVDLTGRERQVMALVAQGDSNKLVAYELGISEESVAVYVHRASRKLKAESRVELIGAYRNAAARAARSSVTDDASKPSGEGA